jgi:peptidoglycan/LPS O-acetylase OafA/YrhL
MIPAAFGYPRQGVVRRALGNTKLLWIGLISYGVYLLHEPTYAALHRTVGSQFESLCETGGMMMTTVVCLVFSTVVAAASYYLLERPVIGSDGSWNGYPHHDPTSPEPRASRLRRLPTRLPGNCHRAVGRATTHCARAG